MAPSDLIGGTWELAELEPPGGSAITVTQPSRYTVLFDDTGRVSVRSDCNSCGGAYTLSGSSLSIGPLACTRAFCGDESLDQPFTRALDGAESASTRDGELTIQGTGGRLRFTR